MSWSGGGAGGGAPAERPCRGETARPRRGSRAAGDEVGDPAGQLRAAVLDVFNGYNMATNYATHQVRSARSTFNLLEMSNKLFQQHLPPNLN